MRTHTTSLRMQAYVNPNFEFFASVLSFILHHKSLLSPFRMLLHFLFLCSHVYLSLYARLGFSLKVISLMLYAIHSHVHA